MPGEKLLVCVGSSPTSEALVRRAAELAKALSAPLIAVHVQNPRHLAEAASADQRAFRHLRLAESLGATPVLLDGPRAANAVVDYAEREGVSRIIVGKHAERGVRSFLRPDLASRIISQSGPIDVHVIRGEAGSRPEETMPSRPTGPLLRTGIVVAAVSLATALSSLAGRGEAAAASGVMIFLAAAFAVSLAFGWAYGVGASLLSVLAFNFFFTRPYLTFQVSDPSYLVTFAIMATVSLVSSSLAAQVRRQSEISRRREVRTSSLFALSNQLNAAGDAGAIIEAGRGELERLSGEPSFVALLPGAAEEIATWTTELASRSGADEALIEWCVTHAAPSGIGTRTLPRGNALALPISGPRGVIGVVLVRPTSQRRYFAEEERALLETMSSLIAIAVERQYASHEALERRAEIDAERLKSTLLRGVSHDLRTPLAAIAGASTTLLHGTVDPEATKGLLESIYQETTWMNQIIDNMLNLTRVESGRLSVQTELETADDLITSAVGRTTRSAGHAVGARIAVRLPAEVVMMRIDLPLLEQVLVNLIDNSMRYAPATTPIEISVTYDDSTVTIRVEDHGPGFADVDLRHAFERFYRGTASTGNRGVGLGMAMSHAIVTAHGGTITVSNRENGGARVEIRLPRIVADMPDGTR